MSCCATCLPIFLFFIKVATSHRSPYALMWNWGVVQIYVGGNCLLEPRMWPNFWVTESCPVFCSFLSKIAAEKYFPWLTLCELYVIASWLKNNSENKLHSIHLLIAAICEMQDIRCWFCFSDIHLTALSVYSSDDYYEYGHSGDSYDSYGECHTSFTLLCIVSCHNISRCISL